MPERKVRGRRVSVPWRRGALILPLALVAALAAPLAVPGADGGGWGGGAVRAQQLGLPQMAILTISTERLFAESAFGRRVAAELEAESRALAHENRLKEAELAAEEKALTEKRPTMAPEEFRRLADAFDRKVQEIRRTQDAKAREIGRRGEEARAQFFNAVRPVLEKLMTEAGATVIFERSSVFLSANATDITDVAIERIDAAIGDGTRPGGEGR